MNRQNDCLLTQFRNMYLACDCGMGYIARCPDGRFILIDGGVGEDGESDAFLDTVVSMAGGKKPVIALWIITHAHRDHIGVFSQLAAERPDEFDIEHVVYRFPKREKARGWSDTSKFEQAVDTIGRDRVVAPLAGDRFDVGGCTVDILFTEADLPDRPDGKPYQINDTSLAFRLTVGRRRALFIGDGAAAMSSVLCGRYTDGELKSDIFQVGHHGYWGGSPELHRKVSPQILLWPSPDFRFPMILRHPDDELPNYRQPRMPEESLRRMWEINGSLVSLPSVRVTGYGGSEQFTVNMSRFDRSPDPWASPRDFISTTLPLSVPADGLLRREAFSGRSVYGYGLSYINGGSYDFAVGRVRPDGDGALVSCREEGATGRVAALQLMKDSGFAGAKAFSVTLRGTLISGEFGILYSGEPPVAPERISPLPVRPPYGEPFTLKIKTDPESRSAVIGLDGNTATAGYDPALMNGIYLILTDAELKLTLLEVTAG